MPSPGKQKRRDWIWMGGLLLLVSLHFWFPRVDDGSQHDSYSTAAEGKKAFYLLLQADPDRRGLGVRRNATPLGKAVNGKLPRDGVVCLLGPSRYPNDAEWNRLLDWVAGGGSLLIAANDRRPKLDIRKLNIRVRSIAGVDVGGGNIRTKLISAGEPRWRSRGRVIASGRATRLLQVGGMTQAVVQQHGSGRVVVVASDFIFSNISLAYADQANAELAFALFDRATAGVNANLATVYFDESLNESGRSKVVGLLLDLPYRSLTVQLLVLVFLYAWWQRRAFGPLLPATVGARSNIVDHTDAVGALQYKTRDGTTSLRSYLKQLVGQLKLRVHRGREDRVLAPIAHRLSRDVAVLRKLFKKANHAARMQRVDRRTAAELIRRLSYIRRAALDAHRAPRSQSPKAA